MDSFLLNVDPTDRVRTTFHYEDDDTIHLAEQQDVTDIVEANKDSFNASSDRWLGDTHRVASIPVTVFYDLERRGITRDQRAFRAWLNDPDNRLFRTRPGRV